MDDSEVCHLLLNNQRTALVLLNEALCVCTFNAAAEAMLYTSGRKLTTVPFPLHFIVPDRVHEILEACFSSRHSITCREVELRKHGDASQFVDFSATCLDKVEDGAALLVEMQPIDYLLRHAREESWQQVHSVTRQLVSGVAHELKNPLGGIRGAAQLLAASDCNADWKPHLDIIIDESDRLSELADQLLGIKRAPDMSPINVHECLERARQLVQREQPTFSIERDYDPSLPKIPGDRNQLIQALLNLARNAVQALVENEVAEPRIRLRTRAVREFVVNHRRHRLALRIDIEDNGPGIPESLRASLFFPMVTGRAEGTGLGLAITQDIVSQHHGRIECESQPGHTCFSLFLPMDSAESEYRE